MNKNIKKPNFFIIGGPKCGTTSMSEYLREHPDVFFSDPKEPHFFNTDFSDKKRKVHSKDEYLKLFEGAAGYKAVGEGSVFYLFSKEAVPNILKFNPDAKFIVMIRNPVDMAYSLYYQYLKTGVENKGNFNEAWQAQTERAIGNDVPELCKDSKMLLYGSVCKIGDQLNTLYKHVDRDKVLIIFLDDMKENMYQEYKRVLHFLELQDTKRSEFPVVNRSKVPKSTFLLKLINFIGNLKRKLSINISFGILNVFKDKILIRKKRPQLNPSLKKDLTLYFKEDIADIEDITSRDLSFWI